MFHDAKQRSTADGDLDHRAHLRCGARPDPVRTRCWRCFWWGSVFLVNVPSWCYCWSVGTAPVPGVPQPRRRPLRPAQLTAVPGRRAAGDLGHQGTRPRTVSTPSGSPRIALGAGFGITFVLRQRHSQHPMIDLALFRRARVRRRRSASAWSRCSRSAGSPSSPPSTCSPVLGFSPLAGALWSLLPTVLVGVAAPVAEDAGTARRTAQPAAVAAGFLLAGVGAFSVLTRPARRRRAGRRC